MVLIAESERLGASFSIDVTNLKSGLAQANRLIKESESEFKAAAAGLDDWRSSEEGLNAKIKSLNSITDLQRKKVEALTSEYDDLIDKGLDPTSKQAVELRTKINNETAALNKNEAELKQQTKALENLEKSSDDAGKKIDDVGKKSKDSGKGLSGLKKAGSIAASAIAAVSAACVAAVGALISLAESTRESRTNMAKLETSFTTAGHSAQAATNTYKELYGILGDDGQATEAAQHLAKLTTNQQELATWTNIATGVYAAFGDSLPIENLTEAANETAKTGQITGGLADALNWAGVSEDSFQESLNRCTTEQQRQALITDTLNGLYSEAAAKYKETNAEVIEAQKAQASFNDTLNSLGAIAEPVMTLLKNFANDVLKDWKPFIELIGGGLSEAFSDAERSAEKLSDGIGGLMENMINKISTAMPSIINALGTILPSVINTYINMLPTMISTNSDLFTKIINLISEMLPDIVDNIMLILPQLITALTDAIPQLLDAAINFLMAIVDALPTVITGLLNALPVLIEKLLPVLISFGPKILSAAIELFMNIVKSIPKIAKDLILSMPEIITSIVNGLKDGFSRVKEIGGDLIKKVWDGIKNMVTWIKDKLKGFVTGDIFDGLSDGLESIKNVGKDLVKGLWNGITSMVDWIVDKVKGFGNTVLNGLKSFFGINSPSKVMADQIGKNLALGIGEGFDNNINKVNDKITSAMKFNINNDSMQKGVSGDGNKSVVVYQTNNYSQTHSRYELYKSKQQVTAAVRLALAGV